MLSVQENEALTRVGKGTPMGELMRRYWHPVAATAELEDRPAKDVRLLGEDLVLFKDLRGRYGLIERYCAHRRVDLSYGIPEEDGLRCMYHGWMYDTTGQCVAQPFEETVHPDGRFKEKVKLAGYPVREMGGLLFAYLGPEPAPLLPRWHQFSNENAVREICISVLPANWLQCQENSLDPVHNEWLHAYYGNYVQNGKRGLPPLRGKHLKIGFDVFEHGIIKRRVEEGYTEEHDDWKIGHPVLFPNILLVGDEMRSTFQFRVPMDDTTTFHVSYYVWSAAPGTEAPRQERVPYRYVPLKGADGRYIVDILFNQDYMAWVTQGDIARRELETLGESDRGIILFRRLLREQMDIVEDGGDPMTVFRDEAGAHSINLPLERVKFGNRGTEGYRYVEAGDPDPSLVDMVDRTIATWTGRRTEHKAPVSA